MEIIGGTQGGPILIAPTVYEDERGYFYESFNDKEFREKVADITFVQDNQSLSSYGVLRGMHFQTGEFAQSKLVRVVKGEVVDVVLDCRKDKDTFGSFYYAILSEENKRQFFVPKGFAHGFITLRDNTIFQYKCDNLYNKGSEGAFRWDSFGFQWANFINLKDVKVSNKDMNNPLFSQIDFENLF